MNKVVNINLNGIIIPIDETAYGKLKNYIDSLHRHFAGTESAAEIISDIETRIAELLQLKLTSSYAVIQNADVDEVIAVMGNPGQIDGEEEQEKTHAQSKQSGSQPKKLRRDTRNQVFGGVCSGIGNYMNIDAVFIRALFLFAFFAFGTGLFIYVLLWIAIPKATDDELPAYQENNSKRLFRNNDKRILGGVCAGVADYFGIDTIWIRLLFLVALLFYGSGIILYIVLWAIIPKAVTAAQKLQMKGQPVDVNNIERVIRETFGSETQQKAQGFLSNLVSVIGQIFRFLLKFAGKIMAILALVISVTLIITMMIGLSYQQDDSFLFMKALTITDEISQLATWGIGCFVTSIVLGLLFFAFRILFNVRIKTRYVALLNILLFISGIILISIAGVKYSLLIKNKQQVVEYNYIYPVNDTLYLEANSHHDTNKKLSVTIDKDKWYDDKLTILSVNGNNQLFINNQSLIIKPSLNDSIKVRLRKQARGSDETDAKHNATAFNYQVKADKNKLILDNGILIDDKQSYRFQRVEITLYIPAGTVLIMKREVTRMMRNLDYERRRGTTYKVTEDGLVCIDCETQRHPDIDTDLDIELEDIDHIRIDI